MRWLQCVNIARYVAAILMLDGQNYKGDADPGSDGFNLSEVCYDQTGSFPWPRPSSSLEVKSNAAASDVIRHGLDMLYSPPLSMYVVKVHVVKVHAGPMRQCGHAEPWAQCANEAMRNRGPMRTLGTGNLMSAWPKSPQIG